MIDTGRNGAVVSQSFDAFYATGTASGQNINHGGSDKTWWTTNKTLKFDSGYVVPTQRENCVSHITQYILIRIQ